MVRNDTLAEPGLRNLGRVFRASKHQLGNEAQAGGLTLSSERDEQGKVCVLLCNLSFYDYLLVGCFALFWSISTSIYATRLAPS